MTSISAASVAAVAYVRPVELATNNEATTFDASVDTQAQIADLTERQTSFAAKSASLKPTEYAQAKLDISAQITALRIQSGEDLDTVDMKVGDRTFTIAAQRYDLTQLKLASADVASTASVAV